MAFGRGLRSDADPEVNSAFAPAVVVEVDQLDGLGVHDDHLRGRNVVRVADDFGQNLQKNQQL